MKKLISALVVSASLFITSSSFASNKLFVGDITPSKLLTSFSEFNEEFQEFSVVQEDIAALKNIDQPLDIHVLFGTWCHDSVREVPRLLKLLEQANNSKITTKLIAVDYKKTADEKYDLQYTPTFVVYKNGQEVGRIIERPSQTLAKDIIALLQPSLSH